MISWMMNYGTILIYYIYFNRHWSLYLNKKEMILSRTLDTQYFGLMTGDNTNNYEWCEGAKSVELFNMLMKMMLQKYGGISKERVS